MLTHGSLFSGVGGLDLGFDAAGIETLWQCEIDKKARSVLARHWPNATRYDDVSTVDGAAIAPVDIVSFGSPCQDLSVAGKRAGFQDDSRSSLFFQAIRVIREMRDATAEEYPRFAIWENVRGALSSRGGDDFRAAVEALADIGATDIYWRLVNTCQFGPPQRRVRVFVVADFGGERAGEILSVEPRVCWHPPTIGETGPETSGETEDGTGIGGWTAARDIVSVLLNDSGGICVPEAQAGQLVYFVAAPDVSSYRVRRLTPRECERLQGWPDDHTRYDDTGKELSDSARYRMIGNGISAPVAQWLGENLIAACVLGARSLWTDPGSPDSR